MTRFVGTIFGIVATGFIKIGIKCTELCMIFSPTAMWIYIVGCFVDGFLSTHKKSKIYA